MSVIAPALPDRYWRQILALLSLSSLIACGVDPTRDVAHPEVEVHQQVQATDTIEIPPYVTVVPVEGLPPLPDSPWTEQQAVDYTLAWLQWQIPDFDWAEAHARRVSGYELDALRNGLAPGALPTRTPDDPLHLALEQEHWLVAFRVGTPIRVSPINAALFLGAYPDTVTNPLFTEGVIHLVESGNFTSFEIFDPMDDSGTPATLARSMIVWSFHDVLALPTRQPFESQ